jgi:hypothetical protein
MGLAKEIIRVCVAKGNVSEDMAERVLVDATSLADMDLSASGGDDNPSFSLILILLGLSPFEKTGNQHDETVLGTPPTAITKINEIGHVVLSSRLRSLEKGDRNYAAFC